MGGMVALAYLRLAGEGAAVRRCVTIASPHGGVLWRGPLPGWSGAELKSNGDFVQRTAALPIGGVEVLSIFSTHDNLVYPPTSSMLASRGGRDHSVEGGGHFTILFSPETLAQVTSFLKAPEASAQAEEPAQIAATGEASIGAQAEEAAPPASGARALSGTPRSG
jgi:pimeloyl-ACP methyl ester carboxylesterase